MSLLAAPLELSLPAEVVPRLRRHRLVAALTQGRPRRMREHAVYFDTPDLALARAYLVLCVRRAGRVPVQTVARLGVGEPAPVDTVLEDDAPDLLRIPDAELRAAVAERTAGRLLAPAFEVELAREVRMLREDQNEVAFALDTGEVRTPRGLLPVAQLALSSRAGDPAYAAQLALELLEVIPLRPFAERPAERARALLLGEGARPRKARPVAVRSEASLEELLVAVVESCLVQITANEAAAVEGTDPEGVHQLRVGARRLRSALALFGPALPERQRVALRGELGWLGGELGPARDADVFAAEWLEPIARARPDDAALAHLAAALRSERAAHYERVRRALVSERYPRLVLELRCWLARRAWRDQAVSEASAALFQPAREYAARRLERRHRQVRKLARRVAQATPAERHQLRIRLKKLRYAAEFSAALFPGKRARRYARRLAALQDALGLANDAVVAGQLLDGLAARLGPSPEHAHTAGFVAGWAAHAAEREVAALPALWKRFERIGRFWPRPAPAPARGAPTPPTGPACAPRPPL